VVLELTLAVMLFVGASVMARSYLALSTVDRGYELKDRYHAGLTYEAAQDSIAEQYVRNVEAIRARAEELAPGTRVAASSQATNVRGDTNWVNTFSVNGKMLMQPDLGSTTLSVSDNYFATLGIPILAGRTFGPAENGGAVAVIVSREFARYFWGDANPIGQSLRVTFSSKTRATVVGVAGDVIHADRASGGALKPSMDIYFSMRQTMLGSGMTRLVVHSPAGLASVNGVIRTSLRTLGRQLPVEVMSLADEEASRGAIAMARMMSAVLGTVAVAGFLLSMMGIYGVVAFAVEQRTREIGVRVALGATGRDVIAHMMKGGVKLVGIGIGLGLVGAMANGKILESLVVGTIATQIGTALGVAAVFGAIALASCYLPARRAAALDPLKALRSE
jgi:putative ABC transport system permease protein